MTDVYFAPMEGLTDSAFRRAHHACFGGVARYYMPFISPTKHLVLTGREKHNVLPVYNAGVPCVPQVLTRDAEHFLWAAGVLADFGYDEVNLNAGCPSATVTTKGKGAGILRDVDALDRFLENVCAKSPLTVSVKTRIGYERPEEWDRLLGVYAQYPLKRLIIHPRAGRDRYKPGTIHMACWQAACERYAGEMVYNGDLFSAEDVEKLLQSTSRRVGVMLGRGLVANPALARAIGGGERLRKDELAAFHNRFVRELQALYEPNIVFMKLRVVMKHLACCFEDAERLEKQLRRTRDLPQLLDTDALLFEKYALKEQPVFIPDELRDI